MPVKELEKEVKLLKESLKKLDGEMKLLKTTNLELTKKLSLVPKMKNFSSIFNWLMVGIVELGIICYTGVLFVYLIFILFALEIPCGSLFEDFRNNSKALIGLPIAALISFVGTILLNNGSKLNDMHFKMLGLEFSGPAAPITLWILCYLSLMLSMKLL